MNGYAGRVRGELSRGGLDLAETSYRPHQHVDAHAHARPMLVLVLTGAMTEHLGRRSVDCTAGDTLFHPAGAVHAHDFGPGSRCMAVQMSGAWHRRLGIREELVPPGPVSARGRMITGTARLLHAEFRQGPEALTATLDGLVLRLLSSLARASETGRDRSPDYLRIVLERIHDDPASDVDLSTLAGLAGVTPEHLARTFRRETGTTVGEYVRALRVERARERLAADDVSLGRLALELGFYDQSHFNRVFRAHTGCTPGEYRRRAGR